MSQAGLAPLVSWPMRAARRGVWRGERPMRKIMIVLVASLRWLTPWAVSGELGRAGTLPQVITFMGTSVLGITPTSWAIGGSWGKWDNRLSSLMILPGTREFFDENDFTGTKMAP
jgi:hypothetical protein